MRVLAAALLCLAAFAAHGAQTFTLSVQESQTFQMMGATAAWAIDASIVEVAAQNGHVVLFGRTAGRTKIVVVSITGENSFDVVVQPRPGASAAARPQAKSGVAEVRYSSATRELSNNVSASREEKNKRTELRVQTVHRTDTGVPGERARTSIPSASYRIFTRGRELTLFDRDVDHSPLTLSGTPVRGVHYLDEHWRVHAGVTAYAVHQSFLLPIERETVFGAAYSMRHGSRSSFTPGVFIYPEEGTVASLLFDHARGDSVRVRAELGISGAIGAAGQLHVDTARDRARIDVRYRPREFAVIGAGDVRGLLADASWSHTWRRGSSASLAFTATDLVATGQRVLGASADFDHRVNERWSVFGGPSWGSFGHAESVTIPIGVRRDFTRGSVSALVRRAQSSTNRGGNGFRVAARGSISRLHASAFVDRQENAPTLDLIFSEQPELARALTELGIVATSPADVARALRENAALIELGFIEGVTVDLAPLRTQFGLELAFVGSGKSRHQLRARFLRNVVESVATSTETTLASLTYSRHLTTATDIFAGYSYWRTERRGHEPVVQPFVEVGLRQRFDGLPDVFGGSGSIRGIVFADEDLDGNSDGVGVAAEIEVDGASNVRTNPDGTFVVNNLSRGSHRVVARVPSRPDAYFTTPSRVEVETGQTVSFGVATTPARVQGRVMNDAGIGIAGVRLLLTRGPRQIFGTTDSLGAFAIVAPPGAWQMSIVTDSVPAGHSLDGSDAREIVLDRARPTEVSYQLRALRSLSGRGVAANVEIDVAPLGKKIRSDAEGHFSLRSLPPGEITLIAGNARQRVTVPEGPASLSVDFETKVATAPAIRTIERGERRGTLEGYGVQLGAYRIRENAVATAERARRAGVDARVDRSGELWLVRVGPFDSRSDAAATSDRLTRASIESVVMSMN